MVNYKPELHIPKLCECGCKNIVYGRNRFIRGHNSRVNINNCFKNGHKAWLGKKRSNETKEKISKTLIGKKVPKKQLESYYKGLKKFHDDKEKIKKWKENLRKSQIKYVEKMNPNIRYPCIGKYEKIILDNLEECFEFSILRQYKVAGYFLDGYCPDLNLVIEINELHHNKTKEKDLDREINIMDKLKCGFINIDLGDF